MKKKTLFLGAALIIAVPSFVAAEGLLVNRTDASAPLSVQENGGQTLVDCTGDRRMDGGFGRGMQQGKGQGRMGMQQGQGGQFADRSAELLDLVGKYSPSTVDEWKKIIDEREKLKEDWLSPDYDEARQKYMEERHAAMQAFRDQFAKGEITREEMREKLFIEKGNQGQRGMYSNLQAAVAENDKDEAAKILGQMLDQFKERNDDLKKRLEDVKK
ncbi:hypothetical protein [Bacillus sp. REN3]|uniref:hypothetical protein n=1 Tax=Bacillus sp. REN3 TaxID=2802440 RepID=UPI001AEE92E4|nr:hypothetical protein [Bacillus sp. REN3]